MHLLDKSRSMAGEVASMHKIRSWSRHVLVPDALPGSHLSDLMVGATDDKLSEKRRVLARTRLPSEEHFRFVPSRLRLQLKRAKPTLARLLL